MKWSMERWGTRDISSTGMAKVARRDPAYAESGTAAEAYTACTAARAVPVYVSGARCPYTRSRVHWG